MKMASRSQNVLRRAIYVRPSPTAEVASRPRHPACRVGCNDRNGVRVATPRVSTIRLGRLIWGPTKVRCEWREQHDENRFCQPEDFTPFLNTKRQNTERGPPPAYLPSNVDSGLGPQVAKAEVKATQLACALPINELAVRASLKTESRRTPTRFILSRRPGCRSQFLWSIKLAK